MWSAMPTPRRSFLATTTAVPVRTATQNSISQRAMARTVSSAWAKLHAKMPSGFSQKMPTCTSSAAMDKEAMHARLWKLRWKQVPGTLNP